ncbi:MAG TPA: hypothetical protein VGJ20_14440 [Xanthobacteraceae bacterium]
MIFILSRLLRPSEETLRPAKPLRHKLDGLASSSSHLVGRDMEPEDGSLWVHGVGEDGVPAFTKYGIEYLKETIASERTAGRAPPPIRSPK